MLVRCNRMYNLLRNYLDDSPLDLSNDHVMSSNSSKNHVSCLDAQCFDLYRHRRHGDLSIVMCSNSS